MWKEIWVGCVYVKEEESKDMWCVCVCKRREAVSVWYVCGKAEITLAYLYARGRIPSIGFLSDLPVLWRGDLYIHLQPGKTASYKGTFYIASWNLQIVQKCKWLWMKVFPTTGTVYFSLATVVSHLVWHINFHSWISLPSWGIRIAKYFYFPASSMVTSSCQTPQIGR